MKKRVDKEIKKISKDIVIMKRPFVVQACSWPVIFPLMQCAYSWCYLKSLGVNNCIFLAKGPAYLSLNPTWKKALSGEERCRPCLQNNPCKSQQDIKKYIFKYDMGNFVRLDNISWQITMGCLAQEPGELWGAFGAFCLCHTFIFMQPFALPNSLS